jgi:hypothetical protein
MGGPRHAQIDPYVLSEEELVPVTRQLHSLVKRFGQFQVALVTWNGDDVVDMHELAPRIAEDGLVGEHRLDDWCYPTPWLTNGSSKR